MKDQVMEMIRYRSAVDKLYDDSIMARYRGQLLSDSDEFDYVDLDVAQIQDVYIDPDGKGAKYDSTTFDLRTCDAQILTYPELLTPFVVVRSTLLWVNLVLRKYFESGLNLIDCMENLDDTKYSCQAVKTVDPESGVTYRLQTSDFLGGVGLVNMLDYSELSLAGLSEEQRLRTFYTAIASSTIKRRPICIGLAGSNLKVEIKRERENETTTKIIRTLTAYGDKE